MQIELIIKNYRGFVDSSPAQIRIRKGFTALVGPNNAGKSSLLRFFHDMRGIFNALSEHGGPLLSLLGGGYLTIGSDIRLDDPLSMFTNLNERPMEITLGVLDQNNLNKGAPNEIERVRIVLSRGNNIRLRAELVDSPTWGEFNSIDRENNVLTTSQGVRYSLRSIFESFGILSSTMYIGPFRNALDITSPRGDAIHFDMMIGRTFIERWRYYKTGRDRKMNEICHRVTDDIRDIFNLKSLEINSNFESNSLQLIVDGKSYLSNEIGSGISQFFMVLAMVATQRHSILLIDEPELNLHPSLQLKFLSAIGIYAEHGVVFCTHNLGLARSSSSEVLTIHRSSDGVSHIQPLSATRSLAEFLGELGFSAHRDLGFDAVLLVEGPSEVAAIQHMLRLFGKDRTFVILPLGGSSLINASSELALEEVHRIADRVVALIDSEKPDADAPLDADRQGVVDTCDRLGIELHVLERRAFENYLTVDAIQRVKSPKYRALGPYEQLTDAPLQWAKSENWKIAREMEKSDLDGTDLGAFLGRI